MNSDHFYKSLKKYPVIASVKSDDLLDTAINSKVENIFLLCGSICNIKEKVNTIKAHGKNVFIHMDLIDGLSNKDEAVDFIKEFTNVDGIISTKNNQIRRAKQLDLITVQRFFLLDSRTLTNIYKQFSNKDIDFVEVLPGGMPKVLKKITDNGSKPLITGGFIYDREDIISALNAGVSGISTSNTSLWNLDY